MLAGEEEEEEEDTDARNCDDDGHCMGNEKIELHLRRQTSIDPLLLHILSLLIIVARPLDLLTLA